MITEAELMELSWPDAPRMVTEVPGPEVKRWVAESKAYESFTRGGGSLPVVMAEGKGVTVKDPDGNLYLDMSAGVAVTSVGRRHPRVLEAIRRQADAIMHTTDITNPKRIELAKKVSDVMPEGLRGRCHTSLLQNGSDAVETAIKFSRAITGRSQIVAFHGAYHGVWCGSVALTTGDNYRHGWGPTIPGVIHLPYAYCYRCAFGKTYPECDVQCGKYVDYVLNTPYTGADDVAAVIIESEQGEGGYIAPPPGFLEAVKAACEKNGCLYVADEVQSGAGRTGKMWAIQHTEVVPDMITWGKGMGGDLPMAGLTYREEYEEALRECSHPSTFAGNAVSCEVSMTNIDLITDPETDLLGHVTGLGEEMRAHLCAAMPEVPSLGEVRGNGLMIGIELVEDRASREPLEAACNGEVSMKLLNRGIVLAPRGRYGNVYRLMPPLTLPRTYAFKALDIMLGVFREYGHERAASASAVERLYLKEGGPHG